MSNPSPPETSVRELTFAFIAATLLAWGSIFFREPLELHQAEEYLSLAQNLRATGTFDSLLRPPGYVAFLSLISLPSAAILGKGLVVILLVQGALHGITTAILREEIGRSAVTTPARLLTLAFACNPIALIDAGYLHYDTLHVFLLVLTAAAARRAFDPGSVQRDAVAAGIVAGALALVRPMTLPWILVLAPLLFMHSATRTRAISGKLLCLCLGMACAIAPHALLNLKKTGHFIPINAQGGAGLWPMTEVELEPDSNAFLWRRLWWEHGLPLVKNEAPQLLAAGDPFVTATLATNEFFKERSVKNLRNQPGRYLRNAERNAWFFLCGSQQHVAENFRFYQTAIDANLDPWRRMILSVAEWSLAAAGIAALVLGLFRGGTSFVPVAGLFLILWGVHSCLYLDYRYLYVRTPLLILMIGIGLAGQRTHPTTAQTKMAVAVSAVLAGVTLLSFGAVFI